MIEIYFQHVIPGWWVNNSANINLLKLVNFMEDFFNWNKIEPISLEFWGFNTLTLILFWHILFDFCICGENNPEIILDWSELLICMSHLSLCESVYFALIDLVIEYIECVLVASALDLRSLLVNQFDLEQTSILIGYLLAFLGNTCLNQPVLARQSVKWFDRNELAIITLLGHSIFLLLFWFVGKDYRLFLG